mmetsp:Transcript_7948/g.11471  ORF Transcript_7948/g.11471 Transcript_7948/m.11471 type:complete len:268 (+) Transcript_7948:25-828(+)
MTENNESVGTRDPLLLDPPKSCLPENWDDSRYELWSIRLPKTMDVQSLNGATLTNGGGDTEPGVILGTVKNKDDEEYALVNGHPTENQSFRILEPEQSEKQSVGQNYSIYLVPSSKGFDRHVNITKADCTKDLVWTDLAPRMERAPKPKEKMIHAYSPIPQVSGLKRRWMPMGTKVPENLQTEKTLKRIRTGSSGGDDDDTPIPKPSTEKSDLIKQETPTTPQLAESPSKQKMTSTEKKKSKKEKKSEKKAKKERKSAKKKKKEKSS